MPKFRIFFMLFLLAFASSCKNNNLWVKVKQDINSRPLTINYVKAKFSPAALYSITNGQGDTLKQITDFFDHFKNDENYRIERQLDKTYIIFNPNDRIASGPSIEIERKNDDWYISDIRFGK